MRISKGFIKTSLIYTLAGMLPMASAFLLLPFYTSEISGLTTSDYGALSLCLAFSILVQTVTMYSFDTSLYIHFHEYKSQPDKLASFISSAFVLMLMIGAGVVVLSIGLGDLVFHNLALGKQISFYPYGFLAAGTGVFQAIFKVHSNLLQSREKAETFFWSNLVSFALIAGLTIAGLKLYPHTLVGPVGGRSIAFFLCCCWALWRITKEFGIHFDFALLWSSFGFNFYSFIYQLQQWVINYFDRFILLLFLPQASLSSVGVYDFAVKCLLIVELLMNGLHNSFFPKVVKIMIAGDNRQSTPEINRYYNSLTAVVMVLIGANIFIIPLAIEWFIHRPDYRLSIEYIPYIAVLYVFRVMRLYFAVPYSTLKYTKPLPLIYTIVSGVKVGLMFLLTASMGIYGLLMASGISSIVEIFLQNYFIQSQFTYRYNPYKLVIAPILLMIGISVVEFTSADTIPLHLLHFLYLVFCVVLLLWVYRNELRTLNWREVINRSST